MKSSAPAAPSVKITAARLIHDLPDSASWEEVMYELYVREKIEKGLEDMTVGRVHSHKSVVAEFLQS